LLVKITRRRKERRRFTISKLGSKLLISLLLLLLLLLYHLDASFLGSRYSSLLPLTESYHYLLYLDSPRWLRS
jgi:hypothetical protein